MMINGHHMDTTWQQLRCVEHPMAQSSEIFWLSHAFTCFHMLSHAFTCFHVLSRAFTCFHMLSRAFTCFHVLSRAFTCFHMLSHAFTCLHMLSHAFTCFHMLSHAFTGNSCPFLMQAQNCITMHNYSLWLSICFMGAASNLTVCCQGAESWFDRRLPTCAGPSSDRFVFWRSSGHCSRGGDRMQSESVD